MMTTYFQVLAIILGMGIITWTYSVYRANVNIVDSLWSLMFLVAAIVYFLQSSEPGARSLLILGLVTIWALRLSIHLAIRNWNESEDRRYQEIRDNNNPGFEYKSLYLVFGLQGVLAWIISIPLLFAVTPATGFHWIDFVAIALWLFGFYFEASSDWQLLRFKNKPDNKGKVLDAGLWKYSRHPNYFGEFCIWWSFFLFALPSGGWWTIYAPVLMAFLLLKVSGVVLMEKDISHRRPEYQDYVNRTSAFFPALPKKQSDMQGRAST